MQTGALLLDTLRLLLARKMFWITLAISAILVAAYAGIGFDEKGVSIFFGAVHFEDPRFAAGKPLAKALILGVFSTFVVPIWLAWGASILALVSTTTVFPDFMSDGAIDLVLSKPLSRFKIFFVKYLGCLLFVLLQVAIFCAGVFFVVGLRIHEWNWMIFAAVPVVLAYFSYLYAFNVLMAVLTRSSIAALLFTILFWFLLFIAQSAETQLNTLTTQRSLEVERDTRRIDGFKRRLELAQSPETLKEALGAALTDKVRLQRDLDDAIVQRDAAIQTRDTLAAWHGRTRVLMAILPKNQETIGLLDRWLTKDLSQSLTDIMMGSVPEAQEPEPAPDAPTDTPTEEGRRGRHRNDMQAVRKVNEDVKTRSSTYVIGTSLGFEVVILGLSALIFIRRDF